MAKEQPGGQAGGLPAGPAYYHHVRREIAPLLPRHCLRILDIGAGAGGTLKWLKTLYPQAVTTGVEINGAMAAELRENADVAIIGKAEESLSGIDPCDLILLLDVLEHLVDPVATLKKVVELLKPGGSVIVSVPNIAHLSVSLPLLLRRRFTYRDAGILDRTHLRFFVEDTAVELLNAAGLVVRTGLLGGFGRRHRLMNTMSMGLLRHHLAQQYIMLGQIGDSSAQPRVGWAIAR
jgi:SAM-dependent methyltransferase